MHPQQDNKQVSTTIPAPVGGWTTQSALATMPETEAVRLVNWFPKPGYIELRKGYREHADGMGSGAVETLAELSLSSGTRKLVACANDRIYDCTSFGASATSLGSGFSNNRWQTTNFKNKLILVNGEDQPQQYDGTTLSAANYTGISDDSVLVDVTPYRSRLYFVEENSTSFWYGGVGSITGALTEFDVGDLLRKGGKLQSIGTWTFDAGNAVNEHLVLVSSMGEVLIYSGSDPGSGAWWLVARAELPIPLDRRSLIKYGLETALITEHGIYSLRTIVSRSAQQTEFGRITDRIRDGFVTAGRNYGGNWGWQGLTYPRGSMLIINIPIAESVQNEQYVMNTTTGSWCQFEGINAITWGLHSEKPYFGGADGKVYEFDFGTNDNNGYIDAEMKGSFNYYGDRTSQKLFQSGKPIITANDDVNFLFQMDTDFQDESLSDTVTVTGSEGSAWDAEHWDVAEWGSENIANLDWYGLTGLGRSGAIRIKGRFKGIEMQISAFDISFVVGGIL